MNGLDLQVENTNLEPIISSDMVYAAIGAIAGLGVSLAIGHQTFETVGITTGVDAFFGYHFSKLTALHHRLVEHFRPE